MAREIPVFPLGNTLFPGGLLALNIFEPRYRAMTQRCLERGETFAVFLIAGGYEVGQPAVPHPLGCEARIIDSIALPDGRYRLRVQGTNRLRLRQRRVQDDGLIVGDVDVLDAPDPLPLPDAHAALATLLRELIDKLGPASPLPLPARLDDTLWVAYRWAELLPVTPETRQRWLAVDDPLQLIDAVADALSAHQDPDA